MNKILILYRLYNRKLERVKVLEKSTVILGIESSCDETSASVVVNGRKVLSNVISSQIDLHKIYGGVVPEIASRKHIENIGFVVEEAVKKASITLNDIDGIAVTYGPGLVGALLVGLSYAKGLSFSLNKPLIGVHHIEGHIAANYLNNTDFKPPFICLVVSGGHTHLVLAKDYLDFKIYGKTRDDAAGEAYDKVARALGLSYPGGPSIDFEAKKGDPQSINFPRAYLEDYDFSFSGLKSSVLNYLNKNKMQHIETNINDVAASFQESVVEVLVNKTINLTKELKQNKIAIAGGVACNSYLREKMKTASLENGFDLKIPEPILCTDNAAMIASAGFFEFEKGNISSLSLNAYPNLVLGKTIHQ